jgi:glutamate racemase
MDTAPIGIFDSGLGGLTVARAIAHRLPHESFIYVGDTARCPYGPRHASEIQSFVDEIGSFLLDRKVKLIVIACNTAAAAGLAGAQARFPLPVLGVIEPGARAAVQATRTRRIGVIGTKGTVASGAYESAITALDPAVTVISRATPEFVPLVEAGLAHSETSRKNRTQDAWLPDEFFALAVDHLAPLCAADIDVLVLGCTHYPVIVRPLASIAGSQISLISSADETANQLVAILTQRDQCAPVTQRPRYEFFTTGNEKKFARLGARIFGRDLGQVRRLPSLSSPGILSTET